ncbi:carbohydrate ABC transporter permease, partial [Microbacterium gubbeenense]|uniref:carbohydrate ABC transporter permease n=1 Tax=Microbacterium gubbeenense TaxID=159896 RepID=UPI003F9E8638
MSTTETRRVTTAGRGGTRRPPHRSAARTRTIRETLAGYTFLLPWMIGFLGLTMGPMLYSLYLSFTSYNLFSPPKWVGFDNYIRLFTDDPVFIQSAQITLFYVLVGTPIKLAAALALAMLLNVRDRGAGFFRSAFYAPSLIGASVSVAIVWR